MSAAAMPIADAAPVKTGGMRKVKLVGYWVTTGLIAMTLVSGGIAHVTHAPASIEGFVHLGYPIHFATLLGIWKIFGAITLLAPKLPRLKEWAYAGVTIDLTGAAFAWAAVGTGDGNMGVSGHIVMPLFMLALALTSWALRPESRRLPNAARRLAAA